MRSDMLTSRTGSREYGLKPPIFEIDARVRDDISILIQALLFSLDPVLEEA